MMEIILSKEPRNIMKHIFIIYMYMLCHGRKPKTSMRRAHVKKFPDSKFLLGLYREGKFQKISVAEVKFYNVSNASSLSYFFKVWI